MLNELETAALKRRENHAAACGHPWFQRARRSTPGSVHRDFYVWTDDTSKYRDARIIFRDLETSALLLTSAGPEPYLHEEDGANCENLPATHEFLK